MKRSYKPLRLLLFSVIMSSCQCGSHIPPRLYQVFIFYNNATGEDLLNPSTPGGLKADSIKLNGFNSSLSNFDIINTTTLSDVNIPKGYALTFNLTTKSSQVIIYLNKMDYDTLQYDISSASLTSFRYNKNSVSPPNNLDAFPIWFPVLVRK